MIINNNNSYKDMTKKQQHQHTQSHKGEKEKENDIGMESSYNVQVCLSVCIQSTKKNRESVPLHTVNSEQSNPKKTTVSSISISWFWI